MDRRNLCSDMKIRMTIVMIVLLIMVPIIYKYVFTYDQGDYQAHNMFASKMIVEKTIVTPHFLYELSSIIIRQISNFDLMYSGFFSIIFFEILLGLVIFYELEKRVNRVLNCKLFIIIISSLMIIGPISLLVVIDKHLYFGYIYTNTYHNPTIIVLKSIALFHFFYTCTIIERPTEKYHKEYVTILTLVFITILTILAKPFYIISFLPALVTMIMHRFLKKNNIDFIFTTIIGIIIPAITILLLQYYFLTYPIIIKSDILVSPFAAMSHYSDFLAIKFLLSILFPLSVIILYYKKAVENVSVVMSWLSFMFGAFYSYFIAESGERMSSMNFVWSGQITLFILFVVSTLFLINRFKEKSFWQIDRRMVICVSIFCLHLAGGIIFYIAELMMPTTLW